MSARQRHVHARLWIAAAAGVALTACGAPQLTDPVDVSIPEPAATAAPTFPECTAAEAALDPTRSFESLDPMPSPGAMPEGSAMKRITDRGRLIVGVSADTLQFGARNPFTGAIEGFDVAMLQAVALAIFGTDDPATIEFRVITYAQRLPKLESGEIDLVAHTMTINCRRWLRINFSSTYYQAGQKVLVQRGSRFTQIGDLVTAKARVCAPAGSTNLDELNKPAYAGVELIDRPDITDCLVAVQQGDADAITADDTVLVGFAAQDPNLEVVGAAFTDEPYGIGAAKQNVDLVRFVNGVLDDMRADGRWAALHERWVGPNPPAPPAAVYGRAA